MLKGELCFMQEKIKKISEKLSKIGHWFLNIALVLVIAGMLSMAVTGIFCDASSVFGFRVIHVMSGSMEPAIHTDQLILCRVTNGEDDVEVGDIVAYRSGEGLLQTTVIHRVIEIYEEDGIIFYIFKGDNNAERDAVPVPESDLLYKVLWY
jgi:signal peptidase